MIRIARHLAAFWILPTVAITGLTARIESGREQSPPLPFSGVPRDIDWQEFGTQVVLHGGPTDELIALTKNDGIVRIALLGLMLRKKVTVEYVEPQSGSLKLISATLPLDENEPGQVAQLSFGEKDNYCRATVMYDSSTVDVWTKSAAMPGGLESAAREAMPIENFDFDAETFEIRRGKLSIGLPPDE
jgi:hypothetical protein